MIQSLSVAEAEGDTKRLKPSFDFLARSPLSISPSTHRLSRSSPLVAEFSFFPCTEQLSKVFEHQMASSSRSRTKAKKVGLGRMDAAFDHLLPWGFSKQEIRSTIKSLLEEYGGDEGWVFLEEKSYELVVETILDRKNAKNPQLPGPENANGDESPLPQLPAPPSPAPEMSMHINCWMQGQNAEEHQQNGDSDADKTKQRHDNGDGSLVARLAQAGIKLMDGAELHVIPPGHTRPFYYGYYSETDSDIEI